jgi:tetratricopeptide (TPR) repeat protein
MVGLGVAIVMHGLVLARAEALVRSVGLPFPGSLMPTVSAGAASNAELNRLRSALEAALRLRPNWAEGHLRLGSVLLGLYSNLAAELVGTFQAEKDPSATAILTDPVLLHGVVHSASAESLAALGGVLDHEPVRTYLVPATRCFLEARRCSPDLGLTHARLAELDYLVERGEPTSVHAGRALNRTGYDYSVLILAGQAAAQANDLELAARCWRKALALHEEGWRSIAAAASEVMTPEQILQNVLPPGARFPLLVADGLYDAPEWDSERERFLQAALERLPQQANVSPSERVWLEAQIRARLGQRDSARKLMHDAVTTEPDRPAWRAEYIDRLLEWGDAEEAVRQARIGLALHAKDITVQEAAKAALAAYARGHEPAADQD